LRSRIIKRAMDIAGALLGLVLLWPVMLLVAVLIFLDLGRPVLFRQRRPGLHGRPFLMLKFRTMRDLHDARGRRLPDRDRLTPLGQLLRRISLDELPTLFNVLRGDMSLVGPRPLLMEYLERYTPEEARRHEVKPGVTGWAQVHGRNALDWKERFAYDVWYVAHWSLGLDLRILAMTTRVVLRGTGVTASGHATMPAFLGYQTKDPGSQEGGGNSTPQGEG
jgi:sugar transferase EpsL